MYTIYIYIYIYVWEVISKRIWFQQINHQGARHVQLRVAAAVPKRISLWLAVFM